MKHHTKTFLFWLPLMVLLTVVGWTVFGALPGAQMTGDLIAWLLELPVVTCYALAAGGATIMAMNVMGLNIANEERVRLLQLAAAGDRAARDVLNAEAAAWAVFLIIFAAFFFPHY